MRDGPETSHERIISVWLTAGPVIALAMGERGVASRILAPKFGSHLTFGALSSEKASAPGQPLLSELKHLYGLPQQSAATKVSPSRSFFETNAVSSRIHHAHLLFALHRYSHLMGQILVSAIPSSTRHILMALKSSRGVCAGVWGHRQSCLAQQESCPAQCRDARGGHGRSVSAAAGG